MHYSFVVSRVANERGVSRRYSRLLIVSLDTRGIDIYREVASTGKQLESRVELLLASGGDQHSSLSVSSQHFNQRNNRYCCFLLSSCIILTI